MSRSTIWSLAFVASLLAGRASGAEEGRQQVMGVVKAVSGQQLQVLTTGGRLVSLDLDGQTRYERRGSTAGPGDLRPGARVVVEADTVGRRLLARHVRIGVVAPLTAPRPGPAGPTSGAHAGHGAGQTAKPAPGPVRRQHPQHAPAGPAPRAAEQETPTHAAHQAPQAAPVAPEPIAATPEHAGHAEAAPRAEPAAAGPQATSAPPQPGHAPHEPAAQPPAGQAHAGHGRTTAGPPPGARALFQSDMTVMAGMTPRDSMAGMPMPGWRWMTTGIARLQYNEQGGPSGHDAVESVNWNMVMAQRDAGRGRLTLMMMNSLEPATFPEGGSPQLFQTGETFEGRPIVDRQHPHDLFMNLSATYRAPLGNQGGYWLQAALRGEPALGPTAFMHRASAGENPAATLGHHLQDSTHITDNVITAGLGWGRVSAEASVFHGQEPDEGRWDLDFGGLDSVSGRVKLDLGQGWSTQVSHGFLNEPEALEEGDVRRTTASLHYGAAGDRPFAATVLWGRNREEHGTFESILVEGAYQLSARDHVYARVEHADKDLHLLETKTLREDPAADHAEADEIVGVRALTLGYLRDVRLWDVVRTGLGADLTLYQFPRRLEGAYGESPVSFRLFVRVRWDRGHGGAGGHGMRH